MEFLSAIPVIGEPLSILIPFLVVLGVVVFVHEYGHYIVGRWCGIKAEVFSIGFGPRLYGWRDRWGTEWQLAALPLGGFVRFAGDMDPASAGRIEDHHLSEASRREAFHNAPLWARAATVIAGPAFNFVLSIALFAAVGLAVGKQSNLPIIGSVETEAAQGIAFEAGDEVLRLDGAEIDSFAAIQDTIQRADGRPVEAVVMRDGEEVSFEVSYRRGTEINQVTPGLPAFGAGMLPGDRIVSLNGAVVDSFFELQTAVADLPLSDLVTLEVEREGETLSFSFEPEVVT
ncbi:MAG: RIP metalloprotease RseP, partial [Pseudomonadota bacterium]